MALRPDELELGPERAGSNSFAARVDNAEYGGRDSLFTVLTESGHALYVRSPAQAAVGDRVAVHADAERTLVYAAEAA